MVTLLGLADRVKLGDGVIVRLTVVVAAKPPEVPVIVTVLVPVAAVALAVNVSVLVVVAGFGLKAAMTPLGNPVAENETFPLKPFAGVMVIVLAA